MRVRIGKIGLEYADSGQGQPLLLIHGYPLNRTMWDPQVNDLKDVARVLAPDLRGHGESDPVPGPYSMDLLAEDLNALLDAAGVSQPVVLCGLSMGGYVAFAFARNYPERVAALVLAATKAGADSPEGKAGRVKSAALARAQGSSAIAEAMLPKMLAPQTYTERPELVERARAIMASTSVEGIVGDLMGMQERPDSTPGLAGIQRPVLVLHGSDDQLIPPREAEITRSGIPGAQLLIIPSAGHLLNLEQPQAFNNALREFLHTLPGSSAATAG